MSTTQSTLQQKGKGVEFVFPRGSSLSSQALSFSFGKSVNNHIHEHYVGSCRDCNKKREGSPTDQAIDDIFDHKKPTIKNACDLSDREEMNLCPGKLSGISVDDAVKDASGCRPRANSTDGELNLPRRGLCDERMVLEAHRWSDWRQRAPKGFVNLPTSPSP